MIVDSLMDLFAISTGLLVLTITWDAIVGTGLVYIPLIALFVRSTYSGFVSQQTNMDSDHTINTVLASMLTMGLVIGLLISPQVDFEIRDVKYFGRANCGLERAPVLEYQEIDFEFRTNTDYAYTLESTMAQRIEKLTVGINGRELKIPVLLDVLLKYGYGFKNQVVSELPCEMDVQLTNHKFMEQAITDEQLLGETRHFINECYTPALEAWNADYKVAPWANTELAIPWLGHKTMLTDYYKENEIGFYSKVPIYGYASSVNKLPIESVLVTEYGQSMYNEANYGYPTCYEWWIGIGHSAPYSASYALSTRLYESLSEWIKENERQLGEEITRKLRNWDDVNRGSQYVSSQYHWSVSSAVTYKDLLLQKSYFTPYKIGELNADLNLDYTDVSNDDSSMVSKVKDIALTGFSMYGSAKELLPKTAGATALKITMPMVKSFIIALFIMLLPTVALLSGYNIKALGAYLFAFIAVVALWPILWDIEKMISNSLLDLYTLDTASVMVVSEAMNLYLLSEAFYLYMPMLISMLLGYVGIQAGGKVQDQLSNMSGSEANSAGNLLQNKTLQKIKQKNNETSE